MAANGTPRTHAEAMLDPEDLGTDSGLKNRRMAGGIPDEERGHNPALPLYGGALPYMGAHRRSGNGAEFGHVAHNSEVDRR